MTEVTEEIKYPLESSLLGSNTVYVKCEFRNCHQNFAICCNIIKARQEGRRGSEEPCSREVDKGICDAYKMRQEEIAAGHALYYVPRKVIAPAEPIERKVSERETRVDINSEGYKRGWNAVGNSLNKDSPIKSTPARMKSEVKKVEKPVDVSDFSAALSQTIKREIINKPESIEAAPVIEVEMPEIISVPKMETVLEKARRLAQERNK